MSIRSILSADFKDSPAIASIRTLLISVLVGAIGAAGTAAMQYVSLSHFSPSDAIHNAIVAFMAALVTGFATIRRNPNFTPAMLQLLADTQKALTDLVNQPAPAPVVHVHPVIQAAAISSTVVKPEASDGAGQAVEASTIVSASSTQSGAPNSGSVSDVTMPVAALSVLNMADSGK